MKEEVLEMYMEGMTAKEISENTQLSYSTVQQYIYSSRVNKDLRAREIQLITKIKKLIQEYELEFGPLTLIK